MCIRDSSWTEELARYSFIYMVAFGVGLAALKHEFVNVEFLGSFGGNSRVTMARPSDWIIPLPTP